MSDCEASRRPSGERKPERRLSESGRTGGREYKNKKTLNY